MNVLKIFWVNVDVSFNRPMDHFSINGKIRDKKVLGFIQDFGVSAFDEQEMWKLIENEIFRTDGSDNIRKIELERVGLIKESDIQSEIFEDDEIIVKNQSDLGKSGIWYKSGRGYYSS